MKSKRQIAKENGYASHFEMELHKGPLGKLDYPAPKLDITLPEQPYSYTPDFILGGDVAIEAKGFLRAGDPKRYLLIRDGLKNRGVELVFVFQNPEVAMPNAKKRKDGSYLTLAEWSEKNDIRWFTPAGLYELMNNYKNGE